MEFKKCHLINNCNLASTRTQQQILQWQA